MELKRNHPKLPAGNVHRVMGADNIEEFSKLRLALINSTLDYLNRSLPLRRIALVASILKNCKVSLPFHDTLTTRILSEQKEDGGWIDCEDTTWCLSYLADMEGLKTEFDRGCSWLEKEHSKNKGWGFCARDNPCIPITAQIFYFLPQFSNVLEPSKWLEEQWLRDLKAEINLNYKGAWYLLAYSSLYESVNLSFHIFNESVDYLIKEQRGNGSWGPWKNHPAPAECFITGICMAALALSYSISQDKKILPTLRKSLGWIRGIQLKNGLFPTHYIEEGSAWIFLGWSKSMAVLREIDA